MDANRGTGRHPASQANSVGGMTLSAIAPSGDAGNGEDEPGMVKYIWGTTISLQEAMNDFRTFLRDFKIKYRTRYNMDQAQAILDAGGIAPPMMALYDVISAQRGEVTLYQTYLHQLRQTGQTNLNLDALNLLAFPPTRRLYHQLANYPQEVIPIMDQVLRDVMIEAAGEELETAQDQYADGSLSELELRQMEDETKDVEARVFKVRPFGGERTVNMRDLNPGGKPGTNPVELS
jgi:DNA replication licensing factor MCM4